MRSKRLGSSPHAGPRQSVGLLLSGLSVPNAGNLGFDAAVLRVIVDADPVSEVDEHAFCQLQPGGAGGEIPSNGVHGAG